MTLTLSGIGCNRSANRGGEPTPSPSSPDKWLFVLAGQSNMAGRGVVAAEDTLAHPRVMALDAQGRWVPAREPLHWYEPGRAGVDCGLSFGKTLAARTDEKITIGLIPTAVGGSSVGQWLGDSLHREVRLLTNFREKVAQGKAYGTIKGILWHQGESDASPRVNPDYARQLAALFAEFRTAAGNDSLPIFLGELGPFATSEEVRLRRDSLNAVLREFVRTQPHTYLVSAADLQHLGDYLHFDAASQRLLGQRYAEAFWRSPQAPGPR